MDIKDENNLIQSFIEQNKDYETTDDIPFEVALNTVIQNAARTLLSIQKGRIGLYAFRSDSTGLACILKAPKIKKGEKPEPELIAILPFFNGGKKKDSGVKALERQLDFYVRDRLKLEKGRLNSAQKSHDIIEFGDMKFNYWEGTFYDANVEDMIVIK
ncbi:MAG: hypothetical protein JEZ04_19635 [Spirochaetales bacterium]|nr:hypothetical protein [Spirochaetales bacterium]